jgi:MFS transporter, ACS family, D-galactonate transporter
LLLLDWFRWGEERAVGDNAAAAAGKSRLRLFRFCVYGLVLATAGTQFAVVPVLPTYAHTFGLSGVQQGAVLGATGLAALAVSMPAGALSDRFGARRLTLWAGALMTAGVFAQALATSFPLLLGSRLVFGIGYAVVWTAGLAWLADAAPGGPGLGGSVASAGAGGVAGPAYAGIMVQYAGLTTTFLVVAAILAALTAALVVLRMPAAPPVPSTRMGSRLRAATSDRGTIGAAAAIVVAGGTTGVSALLVPALLHAAGLPPGRIGMVFAVAGGLFVLGSTLTAAAGPHAVRLPVIMAAMAALALAFTPATASTASRALIVMLCATTVARSVLWTVSYPLAAAGAERSGAGVGVVMGLLNGMWAVTVLLSPLAAGFVAGFASAQAVFGLTAAACVVVLAATVVTVYPPRRRTAAPGTAGHLEHAGRGGNSHGP